MLRIHSLRQISWQHPSQWEATSEAGEPVYIRYKWGELKVYVGPRFGGPESVGTVPVLDIDVGDPHDCQIDWEDVIAATGIEVQDRPCQAR